MMGNGGVIYRAGHGEQEGPGPRVDAKWWPGIHMPREFSRLTLLVTAVRVQRLQDISEADAVAEGVYWFGGLYCHSRPGDRFGKGNAIAVPAGWDQATYAFQALWERINGPDAWGANPWVAAISFDVLRGNIDQVWPS